MRLHRDQGYMPPETPYSAVATLIWPLDDFTGLNGATQAIPGSHENRSEKQISVVAPAGSVIAFDGRVLHGTGANRTPAPRHAVLGYFCRPFVRQQENTVVSTSPWIVESAPPALLELLGFRPWHGLGGIQGPRGPGPAPADRDFPYPLITRRPSLIGELTGSIESHNRTSSLGEA